MSDVQLYRHLWVWPQQDSDRWHCEITNRDGETLHTTGDESTRDAAIRTAKRWINKPIQPAPDWPALMDTPAFRAYCAATVRADEAEMRAEHED